MAWQEVFDKVTSSPLALFFTGFYIFCVIFEFNGRDGPIEHVVTTLHNLINDRVDTKEKIVPLLKFLLKCFEFLHANETLFVRYGALLIPVLCVPTIINVVLSLLAFVVLYFSVLGEMYKLVVSVLFGFFVLSNDGYERILLLCAIALVYYSSA